MTEHTELVVDALRSEIAPTLDEYVDPELERSRCLQASRIGLEALKYFGITARPKVVVALSANEAWAEWSLAGAKPPMPDEAWAVGIDPVFKPGERRFPGHMVLLVEDALLDLDAGQLSRPERGIVVPASVLARLRDPGPNRTVAALELEDRGVLFYLEHPHPPAFGHVNAWRTPKTWAGPVIRRMREHLNRQEIA